MKVIILVVYNDKFVLNLSLKKNYLTTTKFKEKK